MKVEFYKHGIDKNALQAIGDVFDTPFLTTGVLVDQFETEFANHIGAPHVVGLMSCTHALQLALMHEGIGPGDEIITSPMTFIATANAIELCGATTVFADVDPHTGNLDPEAVEAAITENTRGIIAVHLYGHMCDMKALRILADEQELFLVEDCAHAIEAERNGIRPGQLGDYSTFSFYATKNLTSGEGGAIGVQSKNVMESMKRLRNHGMSKNAAERYAGSYQHWDMDTLGCKANMNNIQAAMLLQQLPGLETNWQRREAIACSYEQAFIEADGVDFPKITGDAKSARHLFTIWVDADNRDAILADLQQRGVGVAVNYRAIHLLKYYQDKYGYTEDSYPHAEAIGNKTITLPLYPSLTDEEVDYVIDSVLEVTDAF